MDLSCSESRTVFWCCDAIVSKSTTLNLNSKEQIQKYYSPILNIVLNAQLTQDTIQTALKKNTKWNVSNAGI